MRIAVYVGGILLFLMFVGALSRLLMMKELPAYITNAFDALSNLFQGVYR